MDEFLPFLIGWARGYLPFSEVPPGDAATALEVLDRYLEVLQAAIETGLSFGIDY
jgi:hypothetical protein